MSAPAEATEWRKQAERQIAIHTTAFDRPIEVAREFIATTRFLLAEFRRHRRLLERGPEAMASGMQARLEALA